MNLADVDLNLLTVLDALVEERHLARAAQRLGMSAQAMSSALNKLRKLVGDPVLVRAQGKMVPTPRARELHGPVKRLLQQVQDVLAPPVRFEPKSSRQTFTLAATDYAEFVLLPRLIQHLGEAAPAVRVAVRQVGEELPVAELQSGRVDLVLGYFGEVPGELARQTLFDERLVCIVRKGHPRVKERAVLGPTTFEALEHVHVAARGGALGPVDEQLHTAGLDRHIALRVPSFLVVPMVVAQTDFAAVLPERVARHFAELLPLRVLEPPVRLEGYAVSQIWAAGEGESQAQRWLRDQLAIVGSDV